MTRYQHYSSGTLYGIRYEFEYPGERIEEHIHHEPMLHNICVLKGSVKFMPGNLTIEAGSVYDFNGRLLHCITALEPGTVILNMMLNGKPECWNDLTELSGTL